MTALTQTIAITDTTYQQVKVRKQLEESLISRWISFADVKPESIKTYNKSLNKFFRYLHEQSISNPTRDDVIAYRDYLKDSYKATTVQIYMAALKLFFRWTAEENIYPNVADHVKSAKVDQEHKRDPLTSRQAKEVLSDISTDTEKGARDYAIFSLMTTTGLRCVSVMNADIGDIRTVGDDTVLFYRGKGHDEKATFVKLSEPVEKAIRKYLSFRGKTTAEMPLFASVANRNSGGRMTTDSISAIIKSRLRATGIDSDRITAHSLRHTAATLNLLSGGTLEETQQLLDHTSISTTMIYTHALTRAGNNSENRIASAIFG